MSMAPARQTEDQALFTTIGRPAAAWELPLLLAIALMVLAGLAAACYLSNS
jgi:hypothetical protein